jgi:DNA-binding SARP family transcriptional activator
VYGSYAPFYLRGLPRVLTRGLRDPVPGPPLREHIVDHRIEPWPEHLDLPQWPFAARVRTLGAFALEGPASGGRSRKMQKAPLRLLKLLVAAGGRELPVAAACEALWGDDATGAARRKLDTTLHRLRALLGEQVLSLKGGALTIDRARCFVDAWAFASLADRATRELRHAAAAGPSAQALELFADAEQLYRGPFLPSDDDLPSVIAHREKLHHRFVRLVIDFGAALEPYSVERAIVAYENALAIDERAAPIWRGLMGAQLNAGRPTQAVSTFERSRLALHAAGGAGPTDELRALHAEARTQLRLHRVG